MAPTVTVPVSRPSPAITSKAGGQWVLRDADETIYVELHELAALQDFPDEYPFQGNKTQRARQIGNAVPPTLAEVIVRALSDG